MKLYHLFLLAFALSSTPCLAQSSWLDASRQALPRMTTPSMGYNPAYNQPNPSYPVTTYDPSLQGSGASTMLVPNRKDWKLGVYVTNTDIGAVVTNVAPGSAGQQAGLEPNDTIVAVGTSRIGNFDGRIVELADEIRRNADPMGRVSLLVMDSRQRQLRSLPITMNATTTAMVGTVMTRDRSPLPYGATLTVQLQNVSQPFYEIAGAKSITRADGAGPFAFELNLDPRYLDARYQYQLNAAISVNNQVVYSLAQPVPVDIGRFGQSISLVLERAGNISYGGIGTPASPGSVVNVGYAGSLDNNAMQQLFLQLLGRAPSAREVLAWQSYLQSGNSIDDLKVKLLSSNQFRERFPSDAAYVQQLIVSVSNRQPNQTELAFWMGRLQATGNPEQVVSEMLKNR